MSLSGLLLALLVVWSDVDLKDAGARLRSLPLSAFFLALATHVGVYCLRAWRFRLLIPAETRPGYRRVLVLSAAHNMASYLLPAKTGEASWVVYLKAQCGVRASAGLASLVVARMLDGAVLCSALALSCLYLGLSGKYDHLEFLGPVGASLVGLMAIFALFAVRGDWLVKLITAIFRFARLHRWSLGEKFLKNLYQVALALRDAGGGGRLYLATLLTIPIWAGVFAFYHVLSQAMDLPDTLTYLETVFGSSLAVMANLLPVNGMAGLGTQETGWTLGFGLLGVLAQRHSS